MRIGVLSDTHGNVTISKKIIQLMSPVDLVIHAGDFYRDAVKLAGGAKVRVEAVVGNCDYPRVQPAELLLDLEGVKIYVTHGHQFETYNFFNSLMLKAREVQARLVVFGHTHVATTFTQDDVTFFNPGSISNPRFRDHPTYGLIEITRGEIKTAIFDYISH